MKKISLFSFLAAALLCVGQNAMAQTTIFHWQSDSKTTPTGTVTATAGSFEVSGTLSLENSNGYTDAVPDDLKAINDGKNNKGIKIGANTTTLTLSPITNEVFKDGDSIYISGYRSISVEDKDGTIICTVDPGTTARPYGLGKAALKLSADVSTIILKRKEGSSTCIGAIKIVRPAPKTEPWFIIDPAEVSLRVNPFAKSVETSVAIKGGNLTDGNYDLTLPSVEGLTIAPTSVTVTDGALDATITLTYTSETNVEKATAEASLTIGELTEKLTINYSANVDLLEQTTVSENTTWDWTKAGANKILLDGNTAPKKNDTIVLANIDGIANNADFNSQALLVSGEYMVRDSKFFQGGYISFTTEKQGFVTVEFSHTSDTKPERFLNINSVKTSFSSKASKTNTISDAIAVPAGKVEITFADETANQYARVYKITYTIDNTETSIDQAEVSAKAVKVVRDGQLYILRDGKTYTAQGIVVE